MGTRRRRHSPWWWLAVAVGFVLVYSTLLSLYAFSGRTDGLNVAADPPSGGVVVDITIRNIDAASNIMTADVTVSPNLALVDLSTVTLNKNVEVLISPTAGAQQLKFARGTTPGTVSIDFVTEGAIETWPFDQHNSQILVAVGTGVDGATPLPFITSVDGRSPGWKSSIEPVADSTSVDGLPQLYAVNNARSGATQAFGAIMIGVLTVMALIAMFVASQAIRRKRKIEPAFAGFIAAMLFATVPLRNFLPGNPPPGSWVDAAVVLWVIVALVGSLVVYITAWWSQPQPEPEREPGTDDGSEPESVGDPSESAARRAVASGDA